MSSKIEVKAESWLESAIPNGRPGFSENKTNSAQAWAWARAELDKMATENDD